MTTPGTNLWGQDDPPHAELQEQDRTPNSWDDCISLLLKLGGEGMVYRGQRKYEWHLWSSIERKLWSYTRERDPDKHQLLISMSADSRTDRWVRNIEDALLQRFREQAVRFGIPNLPEAWDILGWWEVMQHHRAPTRLMDWTTSPFIAAWFAVDGHKDGDGDMALWAYDRSLADLFFADGISFLKENTPGYLEFDDRQIQNRLIKWGIDTEKRTMIPVRPRQFARSVAQQSILTVNPSIGVGWPANYLVRSKTTIRIRLKEDWAPEIQDTCRKLGYSRVSLFRDLDSLGESTAQVFDDGLKLFNPYAS